MIENIPPKGVSFSVLCAMGYSGAKFDPENVDLYFESARPEHTELEIAAARDTLERFLQDRIYC